MQYLYIFNSDPAMNRTCSNPIVYEPVLTGLVAWPLLETSVVNNLI